MINNLLRRLTPLRLAVICGSLAILTIIASRLILPFQTASSAASLATSSAGSSTDSLAGSSGSATAVITDITDSDVPLTAPCAINKGDVLTVRVSAPEVSDLYGYQFNLEYDDTLVAVDEIRSLVDGITTIFKKDFDGYTLIGATMTGDALGYSSSDVQLCELKLTALTTGELANIALFSLSKVNVVSSLLDYTEDVAGWTCEVCE